MFRKKDTRHLLLWLAYFWWICTAANVGFAVAVPERFGFLEVLFMTALAPVGAILVIVTCVTCAAPGLSVLTVLVLPALIIGAPLLLVNIHFSSAEKNPDQKWPSSRVALAALIVAVITALTSGILAYFCGVPGAAAA